MGTKKGDKATTALVVSTPTMDILEVLNKKINDLKEVTECAYKTSGNLEGFGDIKNETKVENLIRAFSSVRGREKAYDDAAKELGLKSYPAFLIGGGTSEDWKKDILLRKAVIEHADELKKLNEYKEKMSRFMSEADQKAQLLKEMQEHFSSK